MKFSRRSRTIILWLVSIGLVLGMIITFTPTLGGFGRQAGDGSAIALRVNGTAISELQVARARANPLFSMVTDGEVGRDLEHLLVDELVRQELVRQEAARYRVSDAQVRAAVEDFRQQRGVTGRRNDQQYIQILAAAGFTDQTFREYLRQQLQQEAWEAGLIGTVEVSEEEVQAYFEANRDLYATEERILGRHIVLATREEADEVRLELVAGVDPAEVARERSIERADRDGALGAAAGETEPRPVGRPALPTAVANAAFALRDGGITEVVEANAEYHIVVVEAYLPPERRPFDEVADTVRDDALDAKRAGVIDEELTRLKRAAAIEVPAGSVIQYQNPTLVRVGERDITRSELVRATYTNPQIQQALSPDTAFIITAFFKPAILDQLVDQELAYQGAPELGVPFVGPRRFVAQTALDYVARDAEVDDAEIARFYEENQAQYAIPATADVVRVTLPDVASAEGFRRDVLGGIAVDVAADARGGELMSLGMVQRGNLEPTLDQALFETDAFEPIPDGDLEVSDVLVIESAATTLPGEEPVEEADAAVAAPDADATDAGAAAADAAAADAAAADAGAPADGPVEPEAEATTGPVETVIVLVASRTPERVRPLEEVRSQIETSLLMDERTQLREAWLSSLREHIVVEELAAAPTAAPGDTFTVPEPTVVPGDAPADVDPAGSPAAEPAADPAAEPAAEPAGAEDAVDDAAADDADAPAEEQPAAPAD